MRGVNKVFLLGSVGKDPEIRATAGGTTVANFSLATNSQEKDSSGNYVDKAEWHSLVSLGKTAEIVRDYVHKGSQLFIEGKIQTRSWDDKTSGEKKYRTEILVNELTLLGKPEGGQSSAQRPAATATNSRTPTTQSARSQPTPAPRTASAPVEDIFGITDGDIPF
jgi:single-strand DNA-binding protein